VAATAQTSEKAEQEFAADRPGFATSPNVLGRGLTQVEGGVSLSVDTDGDIREHTLTFGSPLIRIGVGRSVELRIAGDGFQLARSIDSGSHNRAAGWSDLAVGAKFTVVNQGRILPAISLLPSISVPTGYGAFASSTYDPSLAVAWLKTLPAGLSLGGTLTATEISDGQVRHGQYTSAISMGIPAPARLASYVEIYTVSSGGPGRASTWVSDAGVSRNLGANLQIDIEAGRQISHGGPCWFVAAGFALRHASLFRH
jgi:hypothetical protein